jgi:class 3 adenylate cyclase
MLQRVVLFADLRGSTSLFEGLGNAPATELVTRAVDLIAQGVLAQGGQVVRRPPSWSQGRSI